MNRRETIALLGGAAIAWPIAARAQQPAIPVIGFLSSATSDAFKPYMGAFHRGLAQTGFHENQNVHIEYRFANGNFDHLPALASDLVHAKVAVIFTSGGSVAAFAAQKASGVIPIVFALGIDPVAAGLVSSLNRPGGKITGVTTFADVLRRKRVEIVHELAPTVTAIAVLINPKSPQATNATKDAEAAAQMLGLKVAIVNAATSSELGPAFTVMREQAIGALVLQADPLFDSHRDELVALSAQARLPTLFVSREYEHAGGLLSYGPILPDIWEQAGIDVGRALRVRSPRIYQYNSRPSSNWSSISRPRRRSGSRCRRTCSRSPTR